MKDFNDLVWITEIAMFAMLYFVAGFMFGFVASLSVLAGVILLCAYLWRIANRNGSQRVYAYSMVEYGEVA